MNFIFLVICNFQLPFPSTNVSSTRIHSKLFSKSCSTCGLGVVKSANSQAKCVPASEEDVIKFLYISYKQFYSFLLLIEDMIQHGK